MSVIYNGFTQIFNGIQAVVSWFSALLENSGMPFGVFVGLICCLIALDFFVTFIRMQSVGAMMSGNEPASTAREGKILGVKGFRVKR